MPDMELLRRYAEAIENFLKYEIAPFIESRSGSEIHRPINYSLLAGGKRIRPVLCLLCAGIDLTGETSEGIESITGDPLRPMYAAIAIEAIHTYSLIHDDLPAMDNDDFRRGRPSCHREFNEWLAILAGDALNTLAFELLLRSVDPSNPVDLYERIRILSEAAGIGGMICGQTLDLSFEKGEGSEKSASTGVLGDRLKKIHTMKTAAMIRASCEMGAQLSGAAPEPYRQYGEDLGLLFQIADDILDVTGTLESLGKSAGKDAESGKLTYPALYGLEESRRRCEALVQSCTARSRELVPGPRSRRDFRRVLARIPEFVYRRES